MNIYQFIPIALALALAAVIWKLYKKSRNSTPESGDNHGIRTEDGVQVGFRPDRAERMEKYYKEQREDFLYGKKVYEDNFGKLEDVSESEALVNIDKLYSLEVFDGVDIELLISYVGQQYKRWNFEFYGGKHEVSTDDGKQEKYWEGYESYFRREICQSKELITEDELIEFHQSFTSTEHQLTGRKTRLDEVVDLKRIIKNDMCDSIKEQYYDKESKTWSDFDVNDVFLRVRAMMKSASEPFPHYVWNLIDGNPFIRIYRICRDYMLWKGTKRVAELVFSNVCKWESGDINREGEPGYDLENLLWINWNVVGKDFLKMKTKLQKEGKGGVEWLKNVVGLFIKDRKQFYDQFGKESKYYIDDSLIEKFDRL